MADKKKEAAKKAAATRGRMRRFSNEMRKKTIGYILAAFGLVAGLAWNDAIKASIEYIFPFSADTVLVKILYAVLMTIIVVAISVYIVGILEDEEKNK